MANVVPGLRGHGKSVNPSRIFGSVGRWSVTARCVCACFGAQPAARSATTAAKESVALRARRFTRPWFDVSDRELLRGGRLARTNLARRQRLEVVPHVRPRTETPNLHLRVETGEDREHARAIRARVVPDPAQQLEVEAFAAALGQIWTRTALVAHESNQHAPEARRARKVEEDHRVGALEARVA